MESKIIGSFTLSNTSALVIYDDLNDETATSAFLVFDYPAQKKRKTKVFYSDDGRAYINRYGHRYFLDEFMKV